MTRLAIACMVAPLAGAGCLSKPAFDGCPDVPVFDEDGDQLDDTCDLCPHLVSAQEDADVDGIGDQCDPEPGLANRLRLFDGLNAAACGTGPIGNCTAGTFETGALYFSPGSLGTVVFTGTFDQIQATTGFDVTGSLTADFEFNEGGFIIAASPNTTGDILLGCQAMLGHRTSMDDDYVELYLETDLQDDQIQHQPIDVAVDDPAGIPGLVLSCRLSGPSLNCAIDHDTIDNFGTSTLDLLPGPLALFTRHLGLRFHYLHVVELAR